MKQIRNRQIHLDFHTSQYIPDVAGQFDADAFADTMSAAHADSVTVFARCHHGYLYYDSKAFPERRHPNLIEKNLLLKQVKALHARGIKAPVYVTVQWDLYTASRHPEWLIRNKDYSHLGGGFDEPGFYQSLCVNTDYARFLFALVSEICELLGPELDGFFFDITKATPCYCAQCRCLMLEKGIDIEDDAEILRFAVESMDSFKVKMSKLVRSYISDTTIFYNAGHVGPCTKYALHAYSHLEVESLPSGYWGYMHLQGAARYAQSLGLDVMGMTGKFHTEWGDFHSLKNQAALEYECFRNLSYGMASSIGDQLEPCGRLNPATYGLIGGVFKQLEAREPWARPSSRVTEAAVITSEDPFSENQIPKGVLGAAQMLEELAVQFTIIDADMEFDAYKLLILPDGLILSDEQQLMLSAYVQNGGAVLACGAGGINKDGEFPRCFGLNYAGRHEKYPDFIVADGPLAAGLIPACEYVMYAQGVDLVSYEAEPLLYANEPYFRREGDHFCSHRYTPSSKRGRHPVAFKNGHVVCFAHPLFEQYRLNAPAWCKAFVLNAIDMLTGRTVIHDGSSALQVHLLKQTDKHRYALHILNYVPIRKCEQIDIIEEPSLTGRLNVRLNVDEKLTLARLVPEGKPLEIKDNTVTVPEFTGYAIVELNYV